MSKKQVTKRELAMLEQAYAAEINSAFGQGVTRFQSKSKLAKSLVKQGLLFEEHESDGSYHCEWLVLTHAGRLLYCMSCSEDGSEEIEITE